MDETHILDCVGLIEAWVDTLIYLSVGGRRRFYNNQNYDLLDLMTINYDICTIGESWIFSISQVHVFILKARKHIKFREKALIETTMNTNRRLSSYSDTKHLSEVPSPFKLES